MAISYKTMEVINRQRYDKKDSQAKTSVSSVSITKLAKDESINTSILEKVCAALERSVSDIMKIVPENKLPQHQIKDDTITEEL